MTLDNPYGDVHEQSQLAGTGQQRVRLSSDKFQELFDTNTTRQFQDL